MSFGEKLKKLRVSSNLTQDELAQKLRLSKPNISKYEANSIEPNFQTLITISHLFDISIDYLLGLSSSKKINKKPTISDFEHKLLDAYRKQSELQPAVNKLLGVDPIHFVTDKNGKEHIILVEAMTPNTPTPDETQLVADTKKSAPPVTDEDTTII